MVHIARRPGSSIIILNADIFCSCECFSPFDLLFTNIFSIATGDGGITAINIDVSAAATERATVSESPTERMREYMYAFVGRDDVNAMQPAELRNTFIETIKEVLVR